MGFRVGVVEGLRAPGFGFGFRVSRVETSPTKIYASHWGLGFGVWGLGFRVSGVGDLANKDTNTGSEVAIAREEGGCEVEHDGPVV